METKADIENQLQTPQTAATPDEEYNMRTCCGQVTSCDKALLDNAARFLISGSVLAFACVQLATNSGDSAYYSSMISLIVGTYLGSGNSTSGGGSKDGGSK